MKVNGWMVVWKAMGFISGLMDQNMKEIERKENNMEKELILIALEWDQKASG